MLDVVINIIENLIFTKSLLIFLWYFIFTMIIYKIIDVWIFVLPLMIFNNTLHL